MKVSRETLDLGMVMAGHKRYIATGLVVGAAAAAAYVASRRWSHAPTQLINWARVRSVAVNACRKGISDVDEAALPELEAQYARRVRLSEDLIAEYIGQSLPRNLEHVHVFGRAEWIDANISNFRLLFEPFERMHDEMLSGTSTGTRLVGGFNQLFLSQQMGILLGYLGQRVLGQYDLALLGHEPLTTGRLYFVEPNIAWLRDRLQLDGEEFRLWIALHETTHAYEFEANPWLREHMNGLIRRYFETVTGDFLMLRGDRAALTALVTRILGNIATSDHMVEWVMTQEQRTLFREMQALMCLLEGYSNHVMQQVGQKLLPTYERMKERFEARSKDRPPLERLFTKLVGMDVKYEQYALGERFVNEVVSKGGIDLMNRVWEAPSNLPSLAEVKAPGRWLERMAASPVAG